MMTTVEGGGAPERHGDRGAPTVTRTLVPRMKASGAWETELEVLERGGPNACSRCRKISDAPAKRCGKCKAPHARYCSRECQKLAWPAHRRVCGVAHPCPLCLARPDDHGVHLMCFACGFFACEACKPKAGSRCPACDVDQEELHAKNALGRALLALLGSKPAGRHVGRAHFWLGQYYKQGEQGLSCDMKEAMVRFEKALDAGEATGGVQLYGLILATSRVQAAAPPRDLLQEVLRKTLAITGPGALTPQTRQNLLRQSRAENIEVQLGPY